MPLRTISPLMNKSTHSLLNPVEVPIISHLIAISLHALSRIQPKHATFSCLLPLPWTISLTTFNPMLLTLVHIRSTSSTTRRRTARNQTLRDLGKPNLVRVTRGLIATKITILMTVTHISTAIDSSPPAIILLVLHLLLHPQETSFRIVRSGPSTRSMITE